MVKSIKSVRANFAHTAIISVVSMKKKTTTAGSQINSSVVKQYLITAMVINNAAWTNNFS